jgi:putative spermidine/putrescine transport system permease protein
LKTLTRGQKVNKGVSGVILAIILVVLYAPFIIMARLSFGLQNIAVWPPSGYSLISYRKLFDPSNFSLYTISGEPLTNYGPPLYLSLIVGFITALIATGLALMAALAFRDQFKGRNSLFYIIVSGMVTPGVILGLGARLFADQIGIGAHWYSTGILMHVAWTMPFGFLVFLVFLNRFDRSIEEAAAVLGATPWRVFRTVTLPILSPAVVASLLFGFTLSFDEVQRSTFVMGQDNTLPMQLLAATSVRVTPVIYALGTIVMFASLVIVASLLLVLARAGRRRVRVEQEAES